jgi:hypothetical protein
MKHFTQYLKIKQFSNALREGKSINRLTCEQPISSLVSLLLCVIRTPSVDWPLPHHQGYARYSLELTLTIALVGIILEFSAVVCERLKVITEFIEVF